MIRTLPIMVFSLNELTKDISWRIAKTKTNVDTRAPDSAIILIILLYECRVRLSRVTRTIFKAIKKVAVIVVMAEVIPVIKPDKTPFLFIVAQVRI